MGALLDTLLEMLRRLFLGCDIEVSQYDGKSPVPIVTGKGPIEEIGPGPNQTIVVTTKWFGEMNLKQGSREYVAREPVPIVIKMVENIQPDGSGRLIIRGTVNGGVVIIVFFSKARGNMDPAKVRGIDPKFLRH